MMTPHQVFEKLVETLKQEFNEPNLDAEDLALTRRIFDVGYDAAIRACIQQLGSRYGVAATKDLQVLLRAVPDTSAG